MRIAYDNDFDDYTPTASSANSNYPVTNVSDQRLSKVWRTTGITSETITIDAGAGNTINPTFAALMGTNFTSSVSVSLQGSDDNFSSTPVNESLSYVSSNFTGGFVSVTARRYWRFLITDATNTDLYLSVGRVWLGTFITITEPSREGFSEEKIDTTVVDQSQSGQAYPDNGYILREYSLQFPWFTQTNKNTFTTFTETVKKTQKFVFVFDETDLTKIKPLYCYISSNRTFPHVNNYRWQGSMTITEAK